MGQARAIGAARVEQREMNSLHRGPDDDFFCLRFSVWYPSIDCAVRTKFRTCGGCSNCEQGRFNLKRHFGKLGGARFVSCPGEATAPDSSTSTTSTT